MKYNKPQVPEATKVMLGGFDGVLSYRFRSFGSNQFADLIGRVFVITDFKT